MSTDNNTKAQQLLSDIKKTNQETREYLDKFDEDLAKLDLEYAKIMLQKDINNLELAKNSLEEK